jgi:hypothetical protein
MECDAAFDALRDDSSLTTHDTDASTTRVDVLNNHSPYSIRVVQVEAGLFRWLVAWHLGKTGLYEFQQFAEQGLQRIGIVHPIYGCYCDAPYGRSGGGQDGCCSAVKI